MLLKIIYIDDEPDLCEVFEDNFATDEIEVSAYSDVSLGLSSIQSDTPDLLFLDYRLPNTTGDELAKQVSSNIPKALITGDLDVKLNSSFVRIFSKPFNFAEMERFIQSYLDEKKKNQSS